VRGSRISANRRAQARTGATDRAFTTSRTARARPSRASARALVSALGGTMPTEQIMTLRVDCENRRARR